jgi:hypothetical protein
MNSRLNDERAPRASWKQSVREKLPFKGRGGWLAFPTAAVALAAILVAAFTVLGIAGGGSASANDGPLHVVKRCSPEAAAAQPVIYVVDITNISADDVQVDAVNDPMLGGDILPWFGDTNLAPGETTSSGSILRFVQEADPRPLVNTVTVDATDVAGVVHSTQASCTVQVPHLTITKTAQFVNGTTIFTFVITNDGSVPLQRATVNDTVLGDLTFEFPIELAVGETVEVVIQREGLECNNTVTVLYQSVPRATRVDASAECTSDFLSFLSVVQIDTRTGQPFNEAPLTFHICVGAVALCDAGNAVISTQDNPFGPIQVDPGTYTACVVEPAGFEADADCKQANVSEGGAATIEFLTSPIPDGGDGCTPGYWRNHLESWPQTGLAPGDDFDTTFGVDLFDPDITLDDAINAKGGGVKKLARHGTAALLNALHPAVDYPLSAAQVIAAVQAGDLGDIPDFNELSSTCPAENNS